MTQGRKETWYVVSDTFAQIVNLVPALAIGIESIDRILTLRGESPFAVDRAREELEGKLTNEWLRDAFNEESKLRNWKIDLMSEVADKDDAAAWSNTIVDFFRQKDNVGKIMFIYTGGTKDMSHGAWEGVKRVKADIHKGAEIEFVAKHEHRVFFFDSPKEEISLTSGKNWTSLDSYLMLHGFKETPYHKEERAKRETLARNRKDMTFRFAELVFAGDNDQTIRDRTLWLNTLESLDATAMAGTARNAVTSKDGFCSSPRLAQLEAFVKIAAPLLATLPVPPETKNHEGAVRAYMRGGWFEEWVWHKVCGVADEISHASGGPKAEVMLGLKPSDKANTTVKNEDADIDVAVRVNDTLHIVECKTDNKEDEKKKAQLFKLLDRKEKLTSLYGQAWLCDARPSVKPSESMEYWAKRGGIRLVAGRKKIEDTMLEEVRAYIEARPGNVRASG